MNPPLLIPPSNIAEIFQYLSNREIRQVLRVCKDWHNEGQKILRTTRVFQLVTPYLSLSDLKNLRLCSRRLNEHFREALVSRPWPRHLMRLRDNEQVQSFTLKCQDISPDYYPKLEFGIRVQLTDTNQIHKNLFNIVGPFITDLNLNRAKWTWKILSEILFDKAPNLYHLRIEHGILPKPDTVVQKELLMNKKPMEKLKQLTLNINILKNGEARDNVERFFRELFSVTPNLEGFHVNGPDLDNNHPWLHDTVLRHQPEFLLKLKSLSLIKDFTPAQLEVVVEKKFLFRNFTIRLQGETIGTEMLCDFLKSMSSEVTSLGLYYVSPNPTCNGAFPTEHSFGDRLLNLDLYCWKGSFQFLRTLSKLKTLYLRNVDLNYTLFRDPELSDEDQFVWAFRHLTDLRKIGISSCEGFERITPQIQGSLPNVRVGVFHHYQEANKFMYSLNK